jgi:GMP synthase (glutamine-hydrolysing)
MKRILVFKHIQHENLGYLKQVLAERSISIKYVNFARDPEAHPSLERMDGMIVLGGWMGVYEMDKYPHLKRECSLIEEALKQEIPVLGICLGAQMLAHTLGAKVNKHSVAEAGWCEVSPTALGQSDDLFAHFRPREFVFQMHGDTFQLPQGAENLVRSEICEHQAFRYENSYGIQFHLEADQKMIAKFVVSPEYRAALVNSGGCAIQLQEGLPKYLARQSLLADLTFGNFLDAAGARQKISTHGKPKKTL